MDFPTLEERSCSLGRRLEFFRKRQRYTLFRMIAVLLVLAVAVVAVRAGVLHQYIGLGVVAAVLWWSHDKINRSRNLLLFYRIHKMRKRTNRELDEVEAQINKLVIVRSAHAKLVPAIVLSYA